MNHRPAEKVLFYDLLVHFVEPGIDLFPIKQTQSAGDHRKDRKDAYYLYRALWNRRSPTLHITEKRRNMRQDTIQQVKFYSSAAEAPVLTVNKDTIPTRQIAPCQFISDSVVMKGRNEIVVRAGELSDRNSIVIVNALKQHQ